MARCNYCDLVAYRARATREHLYLTVLADAAWGLGGRNVYLHPPTIVITDLPGGEDGARAQYRVAWMWEVPDRCVC